MGELVPINMRAADRREQTRHLLGTGVVVAHKQLAAQDVVRAIDDGLLDVAAVAAAFVDTRRY